MSDIESKVKLGKLEEALGVKQRIVQLLPCAIPSIAVYWDEDETSRFGVSLYQLTVHAFALVEYTIDDETAAPKNSRVVPLVYDGPFNTTLVPAESSSVSHLLGVIEEDAYSETMFLEMAIDEFEEQEMMTPTGAGNGDKPN